MEKPSYREILGTLLERFPGRIALTPREVSEVLNSDLRTVYSTMHRVKNPLPYKNLGKKKAVIPIASLARWMA